ncbi:ABC-F family ATP-binding cassette domain-containing protein [Candidatus Woesebacteria bacterium]|nr:ABC-F family ATP-binding cassette domain-containing protein [Candidatus Woesebacteria bacterium]MBP6882958.1 ABC-F family ATP-binding cassette domain-containing protein [Candidatus Woesebacteria bacterium]
METIVRFSQVSFDFGHNKTIIDEVSFSVRKGMKVALMGQNGAGKSTLFKLITRKLYPTSGSINVDKRIIIATALQVIPPEEMGLTVEQYFQKHLGEVLPHELKKKLSAVLDVVNLKAPLDKIIKSFSGGQQARLLLASALIQEPDLLLLDEPTNNLDYTGIAHLTDFLINYTKSVIVISHDAEFLNAFTEGVLYLDSHTKKIEQYAGNYNDVLEQIELRIERERRQNAQMERGIQENKDKSNFFAHKGGRMRLVAKKMREKADEMESSKVAVRREDKTIRQFTIPAQEDLVNEFLKITSVTVMQDHKEVTKDIRVFIEKNKHLLIVGPNGIGKSTFIESLINGTAKGVTMSPGIRVGTYRQDFSSLNPDETVYESLSRTMKEATGKIYEQEIRIVASGFLITNEYIYSKIGTLSEGQKGLVAFAQLVLQKPGLLILDEPTNHINFRHLPRIAQALDEYKGMMIFVSHVPEFVAQIRIDEVLDLEE